MNVVCRKAWGVPKALFGALPGMHIKLSMKYD